MTYFLKDKLPQENDILPEILRSNPVQQEINMQPFTKEIRGYNYTINPRFKYELYGLVVSVYNSDNWLDYTHKEDPGNIKDICIVWGENITSGSYKKVNYSSGQFTCFVK